MAEIVDAVTWKASRAKMIPSRIFDLGLWAVDQVPDMDDESVMSDEWYLQFRDGTCMYIQTNGHIMVAW